MILGEIYHQIGQSLVDYVPEDWSKVVLDINRVVGVVGWKGTFTTVSGEEKYIDIWEYSLNSEIIHELHNITTNSEQNRWNKLKFTLFPLGKFEIDFIWDQKYQDEIDNLNKRN